MGLDAHAIIFSKRIHRKGGAFGQTATIGRQGIHVPNAVLRELLGKPISYGLGDFSEEMLQDVFGSSKVDSFDKDSYEGATHIYDLNEPLPEKHLGSYDTVLDAGSLEHIYDSKTAIQNIASLIRPGGQIIHITPTNNMCGHGFYQFSPEFFFSIYSQGRGFSDCEVFLAKSSNLKHIYKVDKPLDGQRAEIFSGLPLVLLVRAKLGKQGFIGSAVQQSDYMHVWGKSDSLNVTPALGFLSFLKRLIAKSNLLYSFLIKRYFYLGQTSAAKLYRYRWKNGPNARNRWLTKVPAKHDFRPKSKGD